MMMLESWQCVVFVAGPCLLVITKVTVLASQIGDLCPLHILITPVPGRTEDPSSDNTHTHTHTHTPFPRLIHRNTILSG